MMFQSNFEDAPGDELTAKAPAISWVAWAVALVWSTGLLAFAFAPTYARVRSGPHGTIRDTESFISENGDSVLVLLAVPLVITLLVGLALLLSRRRGAFESAWFLTVLLIVFNALALLTFGIVVVPATAALVLACALWGIFGKPLDIGAAFHRT
jgi:hypothetical protein